jgi:hypothetical protein
MSKREREEKGQRKYQRKIFNLTLALKEGGGNCVLMNEPSEKRKQERNMKD